MTRRLRVHDDAHGLRHERMLVKRRTEVVRTAAPKAWPGGRAPSVEHFGPPFDDVLGDDPPRTDRGMTGLRQKSAR